MSKTTRYLMTDTDRREAYVQDWMTDEDGEVTDVTDVDTIHVRYADTLSVEDFGAVVIRLAREEGYDVTGEQVDNSDLGPGWVIDTDA